MRLSTCSCLAYKDKIYCQLEMQEQKSRYVGRSSKYEYFAIEKNALATWLQRKRKHKTYNTGHILSCKSHRTCIFPSQSFVHPESTANSCCSHNPAWVVNWKCKSFQGEEEKEEEFSSVLISSSSPGHLMSGLDIINSLLLLPKSQRKKK